MAQLRPHDLDCMRDVMEAVARSTATPEGVPTLASWDAYLQLMPLNLIPRYHGCHTVGAMMAVWALARQQYATPQDFISEIGTVVASFYLGDSL